MSSSGFESLDLTFAFHIPNYLWTIKSWISRKPLILPFSFALFEAVGSSLLVLILMTISPVDWSYLMVMILLITSHALLNSEHFGCFWGRYVFVLAVISLNISASGDLVFWFWSFSRFCILKSWVILLMTFVAMNLTSYLDRSDYLWSNEFYLLIVILLINCEVMVFIFLTTSEADGLHVLSWSQHGFITSSYNHCGQAGGLSGKWPSSKWPNIWRVSKMKCVKKKK
jgi:hypothetical protein